jgi:hypothetical protein
VKNITQFHTNYQYDCTKLGGYCRTFNAPQDTKREDDPEAYDQSVCDTAKQRTLVALIATSCHGKKAQDQSIPFKHFTNGMMRCPLAPPSVGWEKDSANPRAYHPGATICYRREGGTSVIGRNLPANQCCYGPASNNGVKNEETCLITSGPGAGTPDLVSTLGYLGKLNAMSHVLFDVCPYELLDDWTLYHRAGWRPYSVEGAPLCTGGWNPVSKNLYEWFESSASE